MRRRNFLADVRRDALTRADGRCEGVMPNGRRCPCELQTARYVFDHVHPDGAGGPPTLENCQVLCIDCDRAKYPKDRRLTDKIRRQRDRHDSVQTPPRRTFQTNRDGPFKRLIGGGVVWRATGEQV